jgi:hypothetical protein
VAVEVRGDEIGPVVAVQVGDRDRPRVADVAVERGQNRIDPPPQQRAVCDSGPENGREAPSGFEPLYGALQAYPARFSVLAPAP